MAHGDGSSAFEAGHAAAEGRPTSSTAVTATDVLAEALASAPSGAWVDRLAALPRGLDGEEQVALVAALERQRRHLEGLINRAMCGVDASGCDEVPPVEGKRGAHRCPGGDACSHDWSCEELGLALQISPQSARCRLEAARGVCGRLPDVQQALLEGTTSAAHARLAYDLLAHLSDERRERIWVRVADRLTTTTPGQFGSALRRAIAATADPDDAATEHRRALRDRAGIKVYPGDDGLGMAAVTGAASDLSRLAHWAREAGRLPVGASDNLTSGQRQVRALMELVFPGSACDTALRTASGAEPAPGGSAPSPAAPGTTEAQAPSSTASSAGAATPPPVALQLTMSLATWLGLADEEALLDGETAVPAALARAWAELPTSVRSAIYASDARGVSVLHRLGREHRLPTAAVRDLVVARDRRCQWPGCPRKAVRCHIDHICEWSLGGCTDPENLHALCARHHVLRHTLNWTPVHSDDGTSWIPPATRSSLAPDPARLHNAPEPPPGAPPVLPAEFCDPSDEPPPF